MPQNKPPVIAPSRASAREGVAQPVVPARVPDSALAAAPQRRAYSNAAMALVTAPTPAALAPVGARLRLKRSPDLLLVEMPGEELGYVLAVLGVGFSIWALLVGSVTLPFCLLFTLLGMFLATPQVLRFERRGNDIRFSLGKQVGGYLLNWGRRRASGSLREVFHTVESPRSSRGAGGDRLRNARPDPWKTTDSGQRIDRENFGGVQSNRRTLVVQTQQREIPLSTSLSWQEGTWLVDQIYAWCDGE